MEKSRILLIGGGGHCRSVLDCMLELDEYDEIGIIERGEYGKKGPFGIPVIGSDSDLPSLFDSGWINSAVTLGSVGCPNSRQAIFRRLEEIGFLLPSIISVSSEIGREVCLGKGVFIGKRAVVNSGTRIGQCAIINTGAIVEHNCTIESFAHISPGAILCGGVSVGENSHIGAGAVARQQVKIGKNSIIGAGSVVVQDIPDGVEAYGNPCQVVKLL